MTVGQGRRATADGGRQAPCHSGLLLQLPSDSAAQAQCTTRTSGGPAHPAVPSALPDVEDTIFPGQPKHAPSSLRGKGRLGGAVGLGRSGESQGEQSWRNVQGTSGNKNCLRSGTGLWLQVRGDLLGAAKCWRYTLQGPSRLDAHSVSATSIVQEKRPTKLLQFLWKWPLSPRFLSPLRIHKTTIEPWTGWQQKDQGRTGRCEPSYHLSSEHTLPPSQLRTKGLKALSERSRNF